MTTCIIIDDNQEAINILCDYVSKRKELQLLKTFLSPLEAINYIESNNTDIVFTDYDMPDLNGLELIACLREKNGLAVPKFIFTTGHPQFALNGFEQGVSDYLLKPISFKRFNTAIDRLLVNFNKTKPEPINDFFFADSDGKKIKINFADIAYIEGSGNYINVFGHNLKKLLYTTLNQIHELLPPGIFIRIHKSYIISIKHVEAVRGNDVFLKIGGQSIELPIGPTHKETVLKKLGI